MTGAPPPTRHHVAQAVSDIIKTVDERARDINRRWGTNRLPHLVPIEWMEKFKAQKRKWEMACFECIGSHQPADLETVRKHGNAMLRAFDKMEELAGVEGMMPTHPQQWEFQLKDGSIVILVRDREEMGQIDPKGRAVQIWSLDEIADIIERFPLLSRAKDCFPGAEVIETRTSRVVIDELDDALSDLPF